MEERKGIYTTETKRHASQPESGFQFTESGIFDELGIMLTLRDNPETTFSDVKKMLVDKGLVDGNDTRKALEQIMTATHAYNLDRDLWDTRIDGTLLKQGGQKGR